MLWHYSSLPRASDSFPASSPCPTTIKPPLFSSPPSHRFLHTLHSKTLSNSQIPNSNVHTETLIPKISLPNSSMENTTSNNNNNHNIANSRDSSPRSRDADLTTPYEEQPLPPPPAVTATYKVKFLCSYGGRIQPRPHDNQLSYVGGDTKILAVDRHIRFAALAAKLSALTGGATVVCFKYQLPGEDLDALISVTNDEDLDHMMVEYDRLCRSSPRPARLRLILFPLPNHNNNSASSLPPHPSVLTKPEPQWFVDALNSIQLPEPSIPPSPNPSPPQPPPHVAAMNPDFLFGLDNPSPAAPTVPDFPAGGSDINNDTVTVTETEFVRLHLGSNEQEQQQRKSDEDNGRVNGNGVEIHSQSQKNAENTVHSIAQVQSGPACFSGPVPVQVPVPGSLLHNSVPVSGTGMEHVPVYLIQTPSGIYQAVRPVTGPVGAPVYLIQAPASVTHPAQKVCYGGSEVSYAVPQRASAAPGGDAWN